MLSFDALASAGDVAVVAGSCATATTPISKILPSRTFMERMSYPFSNCFCTLPRSRYPAPDWPTSYRSPHLGVGRSLCPTLPDFDFWFTQEKVGSPLPPPPAKYLGNRSRWNYLCLRLASANT